MKKTLTICLIVLLAALIFGQEPLSVPSVINYQGFLTDQTGSALNGTYNITFRLYAEASGSNPWIWQEVHESVAVEKGLFNVLLGSIDTLSTDIFTGELYLELKVNNEPEMTPRLRLASVAYSMRSEKSHDADKLDQMDAKDFVAAAGDTMTGDLEISGTLKVSEKLDFPEFFGWQWHDVATANENAVGWVTVVDTVSSGILLMVQATGGAYNPDNKVRITIDEKEWRTYTNLASAVGANGWLLVDDSADENSGLLTIMPFKTFATSLKVELYNASGSHESHIRVNYLTP